MPHHPPPSPKRSLLLVLALAQLMVILDISAVNVALPDIASDLSIQPDDISWAITSYSLVFGSLLLLGGRAADLLGRRRMFLAGLGVFTAASLASAVATGAGMLFAARAGQGVGAALLSPAALSIITTTFHGPARGKALGVWSAVGGAGAAVGVLLGGALTDLVGWRAIFLVNVPVGIALAVLATRVIATDTRPAERDGLDLRGAAVVSAGLAAIVYALSQAGEAGWGSTQTLALGTTGLALLGLFAVLELHTERPLLRVQHLGDRAVGGGFVMMLAASAVMFGTFLLLSLYQQNVLGAGAFEAGLGVLPLVVALGVGTHVAGHLVGAHGVRVPLAAGFAVSTGGFLLLSGAGGSYLDVLPGMLLAGLGLGVVIVAVAMSVLTGATDEDSGMLSGLNTTGHEVGGSIGIAVLATVAADGIGDAFLAAAGIAGAAGLLALVVLPSAASFLPKLRLAPRVAVH